jgi:Cft2 family RNA processing exonuclease
MIFKSLCRHVGIGANSYLIDTGKTRIVLDSGMHPKFESEQAMPHFDFIENDSIDSAILTHAHLDHTGTVPVMLRKQKWADIYMTPATADLAMAMLHNSVNVMISKRIELGLTDYPLFTHEELEQLVPRFQARDYEKLFDLDNKGHAKATFHDAGHILGSAAVTIEADGKRIFYSGDINFKNQSLKGATLPTTSVDALIIETTRGAQVVDPNFTREAEELRLAQKIRDVLDRRGSVLIPVFAIGKTQELLTMLDQFKKKRLIPQKTPIYIGGLSTKMTIIYDRNIKGSRRLYPNFEILHDMKLEAGSKKRKGPIPLHPGCIYALSSGMMSENTASNLFAAQGFLENVKNGLFFVGYADPDSPAGKIKAATVGDHVKLDGRLPGIPLRCEVDDFSFSGHAQRNEILNYVVSIKPKTIFLVHGDENAMNWFKTELAILLPESNVIIPDPGIDFEI